MSKGSDPAQHGFYYVHWNLKNLTRKCNLISSPITKTNWNLPQRKENHWNTVFSPFPNAGQKGSMTSSIKNCQGIMQDQIISTTYILALPEVIHKSNRWETDYLVGMRRSSTVQIWGPGKRNILKRFYLNWFVIRLPCDSFSQFSRTCFTMTSIKDVS